jgi:hypothetical protein
MSSHNDSFVASGSSPTADFEVRSDAFPATVFLLTPLTSAAHHWIDQNLSPDCLRWGGDVVVEHRYINEIIHGILRDGLRVAELSRSRRNHPVGL